MSRDHGRRKRKSAGAAWLLACGLGSIAAAASAVNATASAVDLRIVGGNVVTSLVPWMASIQIRPFSTAKYNHVCGASLVSPTLVMTAAHCVISEGIGVNFATSSDFRVAIGGLLLSPPIEGTGFEYHFVTNVYCHPEYSSTSHDNDICLLSLDVPSQLTPVALNIAGPSMTANAVAQNEAVTAPLTVYGWGITDPAFDNVISDNLMSVDVPVYPQSTCRSVFGAAYVTDNQICAGYVQGGKDACQGDSGGPAVSASGHLVGIVSEGKGCALPGVPGIYTRISRYADFINSVMSGTATPTAGTRATQQTQEAQQTPSPAAGSGSGSQQGAQTPSEAAMVSIPTAALALSLIISAAAILA